MPEELKPCPFCGIVAKVMNNYWVLCKDCEDDCFLENVQLKDIQLMAAAPEMVTLLNAALCEMQNPYAEKWITSGTRMVANNIAALLRRINGEEDNND